MELLLKEMTLSNAKKKFMRDRWKKDPVAFITECLDVKKEHVWSKMREVCESVRDNQFTCVKAGNSVSKSYTCGRLVNWFLYTHRPSTVFTTAPSNTQVEDILWQEIRDSWFGAKIPLGGDKPLKTHLQPDPEKKWFATGFATKADSGTDQASKMLGFHNEDMLIILDEAPGVDESIWNTLDRLITNPKVKLLVIGNPIYATGRFVDCFKDQRFNKITISVFDTPNYREGREVVPGLAGREFVEMVKNKYGEGSNQWNSMITGEFPNTDADSLIPYNAIEKAFKRDKVLPTPRETKRFIVWDVADGGTDLHTLKCYENMRIIDSLDIHGKTIEEALVPVMKFNKKNNSNTIVLDADGRGRIAYGLLSDMVGSDVEVLEFYGSDRDSVEDKESFYNVRDEAHWVMRDYFVEDRIALNKLDKTEKDKLVEELTSCKEDTDNKTGPKARFIQVESKKKEKKRLGYSPDHRDNIMMACYANEYFDIEPITGISDYGFGKKSSYEEDYYFNPATC